MKASFLIFLTVVLAGVSRASAERDRVLFDFEKESFAGWTYRPLTPDGRGEAFGPRPVQPEIDLWPRSANRPSYKFTGWQGSFLVSSNVWLSFKHNFARPFKTPAGELVSDEFVLDRRHLGFLFAGLLHPGLRVELRLGDQAVRQAYGNNSFDLRPRSWDVAEWAGRKARLAIVYDVPEPARGLLRADHFFLSDRPAPEDALTRPLHERDNRVVRPGEFRPILDTRGVGSGALDQAHFARDAAGRWHVVLEEEKVPGSALAGWFAARNDTLYHSSAPTLTGPWTTPQPILKRDAARGEDWLRFPQVIAHAGKLFLFYSATGRMSANGEHFEGTHSVRFAESTDGETWTRRDGPPLFSVEGEFGDLSVIPFEGGWRMYYLAPATSQPAAGAARRTLWRRDSPDLLRWSEPRHAMTGEPVAFGLDEGDVTIFRRDGWWYLLARGHPTQWGRTRFLFTDVWRSRTPDSWDFERDYLGLIDAWGSNAVVLDESGAWQIVHGYQHSGGLWLAPLHFKEP